MHKIRAEEVEDNIRLDVYLVEALEETVTRGDVQRMIKEGQVLVNSKVSKANYRVKEDDVIEYELLEKVFELKPIEMNLEVIFEDEHLMVVNKPRGLVVHPSPSTLDRPTLVHGLLAHTSNLSDLNGELRPGIVHRLDKDTSGLLLVAKTNEAHEGLVNSLRNRDVLREYQALVHHPFEHKQALVDAPIGRDPKNRQRMAVTEQNSKDAKTHITLLENFKEYAFLKCKLETGRTHQIRVHLSYIQHPLVGDVTYSYKNTLKTEGQLLHAFHLGFTHPITGQYLEFETPMSQIMSDQLEEFRNV